MVLGKKNGSPAYGVCGVSCVARPFDAAVTIAASTEREWRTNVVGTSVTAAATTATVVFIFYTKKINLYTNSVVFGGRNCASGFSLLLLLLHRQCRRAF